MAADPFGGDVRKLKDGSGYRRRIGSYRICFDTDQATQQISVTAIERRRSTTYRRR
jgi:mRNA-degrading endonuclease RelE of RelBE toxin-antitoxin system